ncbi:MFS transporter [Knoellia aerolata]|uniref:DeoR family transcripitonal regulator n=1 Tax=Knoellia aerolata DSM 18566 TaxID=1385519 RepID=A0A0A0JUC0_9MICO|nr:MFS transporter [Knoellia aerolata]KGN40309.1 DeoR family transcripitonal regulator [Knoellia aerolata DSM 18566]
MTSPALPRERVVSARTAVFVVFALAGVAFATWASRIADAKATLGLTAGELGLTLFAMSAGSLLAMPSTGRFADRFGVVSTIRAGMLIGVLGFAVVGAGVDLAESRAVVAVGLFLIGSGVGVWDVAMNLEGAGVERLLGQTVMPQFHAAFSGGTVLSALVGAGMSWGSVPLLPHLLGSALVVTAGGFWAMRQFLPRELEDAEAAGAAGAEAAGAHGSDAATEGNAVRGPRSAWLEPRTLLIGLVTLVAAFTEGTANDWLAVAFVEGHGVPAWAGVLAFATFLTFMTVGRLLGTRWLDTYGRVPVLRLTFALAVLGSVLVIFGNPWLAFVGAAVWGVGVSLGFPVGMSASADDPARAGARMSVVATIGYLAFIAGPPALGFLGDHVGVLRSLLAVGTMALLVQLILESVREPVRELVPGPEPTAAVAAGEAVHDRG